MSVFAKRRGNCKAGAVTDFAFQRDAAAVQVDGFLDDRETRAGAGNIVDIGCAMEGLKHAAVVFSGYADTPVGDFCRSCQCPRLGDQVLYAVRGQGAESRINQNEKAVGIDHANSGSNGLKSSPQQDVVRRGHHVLPADFAFFSCWVEWIAPDKAFALAVARSADAESMFVMPVFGQEPSWRCWAILCECNEYHGLPSTARLVRRRISLR